MRTGRVAAEEVHPGGLFAYLSEQPGANSVFNAAMAAKAGAQVAGVLAAYDFSRFGMIGDIDGTISTEVAIAADKQEYDDIVTIGLPLGNDGEPVPSQAGCGCALIPKGAKNVAAAKDFLKYLNQPNLSSTLAISGVSL